MKTTRLEDELLLIAQVELALEKVPSLGEPAKQMSRQLQLMLAKAYYREHVWAIGFFTSLMVNVMLLMGVFL
jgi:hypothetical protein